MAWKYGDIPVQIDPSNCGCTECIIGMYANEGSEQATETFEALAKGEIEDVRSATGRSYAVWMDLNNNLQVEEFSGDPSQYTVAVIPGWDYQTVLMWKDTFGDPHVREINCHDADAVKFVLDI